MRLIPTQGVWLAGLPDRSKGCPRGHRAGYRALITVWEMKTSNENNNNQKQKTGMVFRPDLSFCCYAAVSSKERITDKKESIYPNNSSLRILISLTALSSIP